MKTDDLVAALDLPDRAHLEQRVPKKLLIENGAPTAADKRRITEGIEEVHWLAALKPTTVAVPAFRDTTREYLEVAVLHAALRAKAQASRLSELIHRAVPYPVFLIASQGNLVAVSLAHKRWSLGETARTVLDGALVAAEVRLGLDNAIAQSFLKALSITRQPRDNLYALYQGWVDTVSALLVAGITGTFSVADSPDHAAARRSALLQCARLNSEMAVLRAAAAKEKQLPRRVQLNLEMRRVESEYSAARAKL